MHLPTLKQLTLKTFHDGLEKKEFRALEVVQATFEHIKERNPSLGAYLSTMENEAVTQAEKVDLAVAEGDPVGPLAGAALAIKDNILIEGHRATAASKILEHYRASYDATVITKLKEQQAVFLGKTNLDEFAMGSSTENSAFGVTRNPHDETKVPGGSSGGSVAAVAADLALGALGSDTGGSIRQPAGLCGVVGLKPTYGAVSRFGVMSMASSLDQIGPIAKTVDDTALLFSAIAGHDDYDATSTPTDYGHDLLKPDFAKVQKLTVGLPSEYFGEGIDPAVRQGVEEAIAKIKSLGLSVKPVSLPHTKYALSCYYIIMPAEVSANLARFEGIRYGRNEALGKDAKNLEDLYRKQRSLFGTEVKRRIILGTYVLSSGYYDAYYNKAQQVRSLLTNDFAQAFKTVDVILTPVSPTKAFTIGEKISDPLSMYLSDIFTITVNLAGVPALAMPVENFLTTSYNPDHMPVGFQLIGRHFREADLFGLGHFYEKIGETK